MDWKGHNRAQKRLEKPELVTKKRPEKSTKGHKKTWKVHNREQKKTRKITVGHKKKTEERLGTGERLGILERKIGKIKRELKKKDWKDHKGLQKGLEVLNGAQKRRKESLQITVGRLELPQQGTKQRQ